MFDRNINARGRYIRGAGGAALLVGALFGFQVDDWLGWLMLASAALLLFQALKGWCIMRACGVKTSY